MLFQIASTIGIAMKNGYAFAFPPLINHDHKERFGSSEDVDLQKYFVNKLPATNWQLPDFPIPWGYNPDLEIPDNVSLSGHMQSEKYFDHCIDLVRHYFTMKDEPPQNESVAVHWRLGDYDDRYHPRLTIDYYRKALEAVGGNEPVLVFSDDGDKAMQLAIILSEETNRPFGVSLERTYLEDFRFMKRCKHFITGNSSFSLMAAILGNHPDKKIVCPSNWFGEAWGSGYREMAKDIYPENSIII